MNSSFKGLFSRAAAGIICLLVFATSAQALIITPTFTVVSVDTTNAQSTTVLRANLVGLGISQVSSITVKDSNSGTGGSAGAYSGFDLDALFLDLDGDYLTLSDQIYASSFNFTAGAIRAGGAPASNTAGALNGSINNSTVDEAFASLNTVDADFFGAGSLSLGDGGSLLAIFDQAIAIGGSLFLIAGEVGTGIGEDITGLIEISDTPVSVPEPSSLFLMGMGLAALGFTRRRKTK
jgi:hypothetical protein